MRLVPFKQGVATALGLCARGAEGEVKLLTFKKDRSVAVRAREGSVRLEEEGFEDTLLVLEAGPAAKRAVREAIGREFPRSNKVYLSPNA